MVDLDNFYTEIKEADSFSDINQTVNEYGLDKDVHFNGFMISNAMLLKTIEDGTGKLTLSQRYAAALAWTTGIGLVGKECLVDNYIDPADLAANYSGMIAGVEIYNKISKPREGSNVLSSYGLSVKEYLEDTSP